MFCAFQAQNEINLLIHCHEINKAPSQHMFKLNQDTINAPWESGKYIQEKGLLSYKRDTRIVWWVWWIKEKLYSKYKLLLTVTWLWIKEYDIAYNSLHFAMPGGTCNTAIFRRQAVDLFVRSFLSSPFAVWTSGSTLMLELSTSSSCRCYRMNCRKQASRHGKDKLLLTWGFCYNDLKPKLPQVVLHLNPLYWISKILQQNRLYIKTIVN